MKQEATLYYFDRLVSAPETGCAWLFNDLDSPPHKHVDFYEIMLVTCGSFKDEYKDETTILEQNSLIFYRMGEEHSMTCNEENSIQFSFVLSEEAFERYCEKFEIDLGVQGRLTSQLTSVQGEYLAMLARNIRNSLQIGKLKQHVDLFAMNAFSWLVMQEENYSGRCLDQFTEDLVKNLDHFRLLNCYIKDIYRRYPVASSALIANFKKHTGYTIVQYVGKRRMDYAAQLLATKDYTITQIANMLNLTSCSYFAMKFKEQFGVSPLQYRQASKNILYNWTEDVDYGFEEREKWDKMM